MILPTSRLNYKSLRISTKATSPNMGTAAPQQGSQKDGEYKDSLGRRYCIQKGQRVDCAEKPQEQSSDKNKTKLGEQADPNSERVQRFNIAERNLQDRNRKKEEFDKQRDSQNKPATENETQVQPTDKKTDTEPDFSDPKFAKEWDEEVAKHIPDIKENNAAAHDFDAQQLAAEQDWHSDYIKYRYGLNVGKNEIKPEEIPMAARMMSGLMNPKMGEDYITELEQKFPTKGKVRPNVANTVFEQLRKVNPTADQEHLKAVANFSASLFGHQASAIAKHLAENNVDETGEEKEAPGVNTVETAGTRKGKESLKNSKYGEWQPPSEKQGGNEDDHRMHWMNQLKKKAKVNGIKITPDLEERARQAIKEELGSDHLDYSAHGSVARELEKILDKADQFKPVDEENIPTMDTSPLTHEDLMTLPPEERSAAVRVERENRQKPKTDVRQQAGAPTKPSMEGRARRVQKAEAKGRAQGARRLKETPAERASREAKEQVKLKARRAKQEAESQRYWESLRGKYKKSLEAFHKYQRTGWQQKDLDRLESLGWNESKMLPSEIGLWDAAYRDPSTNIPQPQGYEERKQLRQEQIREKVLGARGKAMSWLDTNNGGALVPPPAMGKPILLNRSKLQRSVVGKSWIARINASRIGTSLDLNP